MNFVDNRIDPGSGTIRARAVLPNPDLFITPGQFGRLRVPGSNDYDAILVPDSAIVTDQSNQHRDDGRRGRHGRAEADPARAVAAGRPEDRARGPDGRREDHHQRPGARPAGRQGDAGGGHDRARGRR